jgi:hypothetical protein
VAIEVLGDGLTVRHEVDYLQAFRVLRDAIEIATRHRCLT